MSSYGTFRGRDGLREAANLLERQLGSTRYDYRHKAWHGELGFLEWTARSRSASVDDGADSYLIRNGRIVAMTAHYTVLPVKDAQ